MHRAAAEAVLVGALAGLIGVRVLRRRLSFFTMALTHATFPGVVAATIIGVNIYLGGALAGTVVALGVAALSRGRGQNASAATGVLLSGGFALGVALVALRDGFSRDLSSFLVGSILTVSTSDVATTAAVLVVVGVVLAVTARPMLFAGFDGEGARAAGLPTGALDLVLLLCIEVVIVTAVPAIGTIPGAGPDRGTGRGGPRVVRPARGDHAAGDGVRRPQRAGRPGGVRSLRRRRRRRHHAGRHRDPAALAAADPHRRHVYYALAGEAAHRLVAEVLRFGRQPASASASKSAADGSSGRRPGTVNQNVLPPSGLDSMPT